MEQYRTLPLPVGSGRALALDEAHKFMDGEQSYLITSSSYHHYYYPLLTLDVDADAFLVLPSYCLPTSDWVLPLH